MTKEFQSVWFLLDFNLLHYSPFYVDRMNNVFLKATAFIYSHLEDLNEAVAFTNFKLVAPRVIFVFYIVLTVLEFVSIAIIFFIISLNYTKWKESACALKEKKITFLFWIKKNWIHTDYCFLWKMNKPDLNCSSNSIIFCFSTKNIFQNSTGLLSVLYWNESLVQLLFEKMNIFGVSISLPK